MYSSNAAQLTQRNNHPTEQTIESIMQDSRTTISTPPTAPEDDGGGIPLFSKNMRHLLWFVIVKDAVFVSMTKYSLADLFCQVF